MASFEIFVTWIYKGVVEDIDIGDWASKKQVAIEAWLLGDKWCMHKFQNKILEAFQNRHKNWAASAGDLICVCQLELRDSKLGNYLFDQLAYDLVHVWKNQFGDECPGLRQSLQLLTEEQPELAVRMLETVCREGFGQTKSPSREKGCKYC